MAQFDKNSKYYFDGEMPLEVLNNYLDRAMTYSLCGEGDPAKIRYHLLNNGKRVIKNVGVKYVARATGPWIASGEEEADAFPVYEAAIKELHEFDPEIIFEACIFETCTNRVNNIPIEEDIQKLFGYKSETGYFNCDNMKLTARDGYFLNRWSEGNHVPDITLPETQMFFYHRARKFIDMGYEALHLGQANLIGWSDEGNKCWTKVIRLIEEYARHHARRHYVIIDCHHPSQNFVGSDGIMLVDFNMFPLRVEVAPCERDHAVSEDNPQRCDIHPGLGDSVYLRGIKGISPSGWFSDKYPYMVEFDNWGSGKDHVTAVGRWGYDEIAWWANQPQWYRHAFLKYVIERVAAYKENGHVASPGFRPAQIQNSPEHNYWIDSKEHYEFGFDDEEFVKALWNKRDGIE